MANLLDALLQDLRFGARVLLKNPAFTLVAMLALALGIAANTAIFSVVNAVLLQPLPYKDADHLVKVWGRFTGIGLPNDQNWFSAPEFRELQQLNKSFTHVAAISGASFNINADGTPERIEGAQVSAGFFSLLGVQAHVGRTFLPGEDEPGRDNVVVLTHGLWNRRFGGDRNVSAKTINVNGRTFSIAGVLPPDFQFPGEAEMWAPLAFSPDALGPGNRGSHGLEVLARIKPELSLQQARADMATVTRRIIEQNKDYPYRRFDYELLLVPLLDEVVGDIRAALWILMGAVGFVLMIACANVANLLLARGAARDREIAVRGALGAGRARLVRQLLTESLLLSLLGGIAGLLLAHWGLRVLIHLSEATYPRIAGATLDGSVLAFTILISLLTGVLFGIVPALQSSRLQLHDSLKESTRAMSSGPASLRLRRLLIAAEIALSLVLLVGAGLLIKSFLRLQDVDGGFRPEGVLTMRISLPQPKYAQPELRRAFFRELMNRVSRLPGVEAAGGIAALPVTGAGGSGTTTVDSRAVSGDKASPEADWRAVTPDAFRALGVALLKGRYFDDRDNETSEPVAIIDETMSRTFWPDENPIGRRLKRGGAQSTNPWMKIVGVVKHVRYRTLETPSRVQLYWPHAQTPTSALSLAIHSSLDPGSLTNAVRAQVSAIDRDQPLYRVRTMEQILSDSLARRRLLMVLLAIFAGCALLLAAVGIYGVMSYSVSQRAHEIGIRMALGAKRYQVLKLVLAQSFSLTLAGVAAGLIGSYALTKLMATLLFNVGTKDPATFALVAGTLTIVALLASYLPARRATLVDPMRVLRDE
ncbi:MAG TPA: ABC transporter permease [Acidobacteriota bacterium]|jgi:putative ABC transport system permease protein